VARGAGGEPERGGGGGERVPWAELRQRETLLASHAIPGPGRDRLRHGEPGPKAGARRGVGRALEMQGLQEGREKGQRCRDGGGAVRAEVVEAAWWEEGDGKGEEKRYFSYAVRAILVA
jgi:hypothetical protein